MAFNKYQNVPDNCCLSTEAIERIAVCILLLEPPLNTHPEFEDDCKKKKFSARYIGSLVADFHRNLLKGGLYMYPATAKSPKGKLRLLYEANPLAFIAEQAGGSATDGTSRIMDMKPTELHQRCPLFIGSKGMVERAVKS